MNEPQNNIDTDSIRRRLCHEEGVFNKAWGRAVDNMVGLTIRPFKEIPMCNCGGTKAEKRLADAFVGFYKLHGDIPTLFTTEGRALRDAFYAVLDERNPKERWTTGPSLGIPGWSVFCGGTWNCSFAMTVDAEAYARYKNRTQP